MPFIEYRSMTVTHLNCATSPAAGWTEVQP